MCAQDCLVPGRCNTSYKKETRPVGSLGEYNVNLRSKLGWHLGCPLRASPVASVAVLPSCRGLLLPLRPVGLSDHSVPAMLRAAGILPSSSADHNHFLQPPVCGSLACLPSQSGAGVSEVCHIACFMPVARPAASGNLCAA